MGAPPRRRCAVTIDLDPFRVLQRYWGLADDGDDGVFYSRAVPRLIETLGKHGVRATFFVIGSDVAPHREWMRLIVAAGHELGNHSHTHPHAFARLDDRAMSIEVEGAEAAIAEVAGDRPRGFRAPGYDVSERVTALLERRGYAYDTSVFPSSFIVAARIYQLLMGAGRSQRGALGRLAFVLAPLSPYRPDPARLWRAAPGGTLVELPVATLPLLRLPFHFTALLALGGRYGRWALGRLGQSDLCFVLHGIDALGMDRDPIDPLLRRHPGMSWPLAQKMDLLEATLDALTRRYEVVTARQLAAWT